jgi:hypothetical protein
MYIFFNYVCTIAQRTMFLKILGMLAILLSFSSGAKAQCDDLDPEESIYGYRERGGRCEGFYNANVSGFTIQVVSLTRGVVSYAMNSNERLQIVADPLVDFPTIAVRGVNFSMGRNYRLDLNLEKGAVAEVPVKEVLQPNRISSDNLGIFGFVEKAGYRYYVPIVPMSALSNAVKNSDKLNLQLVSNLDVKSVSWRYAISDNDRCGKYSEIRELPKGSYPRNSPIGLELPTIFLDAPEEVMLCIQVNIQAVNGQEFNDNVRLLIPKASTIF